MTGRAAMRSGVLAAILGIVGGCIGVASCAMLRACSGCASTCFPHHDAASLARASSRFWESAHARAR